MEAEPGGARLGRGTWASGLTQASSVGVAVPGSRWPSKPRTSRHWGRGPGCPLMSAGSRALTLSSSGRSQALGASPSHAGPTLGPHGQLVPNKAEESVVRLQVDVSPDEPVRHLGAALGGRVASSLSAEQVQQSETSLEDMTQVGSPAPGERPLQAPVPGTRWACHQGGLSPGGQAAGGPSAGGQ